MLAIGRALLLNPHLLVMDEPSEGLAPTIVENVIETCHSLVGEGMGILLVEQNLGVATRSPSVSWSWSAARSRPRRRRRRCATIPTLSAASSASSRRPLTSAHQFCFARRPAIIRACC